MLSLLWLKHQSDQILRLPKEVGSVTVEQIARMLFLVYFSDAFCCLIPYLVTLRAPFREAPHRKT